MPIYQGSVVTEMTVLKKAALVCSDDGVVQEIQSPARVNPSSVTRDFGSALIVPGFVDMHVHGGGGGDFMSGDEQSVRTALCMHARFGTTTLLATTIAASREETDLAIRAIMKVHKQPQDGARLAGIHLEGPYICAARKGAQPESAVRPGSVEEFNHWMELAEGTVRQITLAPEQPGCDEVIRAAVSKGVVVSAGHTDATATDTAAAIALGVRQVTHTFNAMRPLHHREPGLLGAALVAPVLKCEVIADGVHVAPQVVKLAHLAKGDHGIILITDAIVGAAMPDGEYSLGGNLVVVKAGTASFPDGTLAGSVLTMNRAWSNIMEYADVGPVAASLMSSLNAARQLGLDDQIGSIAVGKRADFAVLEPNGAVVATVIGGKMVYSASG